MPKLILSRKGFDSGSGGAPSIIYKNKMISIPIPQMGTQAYYQDLKALRGVSYRKMMDDLKIKPYEEAHLDPDLIKFTRRKRPKDWKPVFGQTGAALSHLQSNQVGVGDLFLFFGWFREVVKKNGKFCWKKGAPDLHVIYGYLEVGEVIDLSKENPPRWARRHPHVVLNEQLNPKGNVLFVGAERLSLNDRLPRAGVFPFDEKYVLTSSNRQNRKRSVWELPSVFFDEEGFCRLTYHQHRKGIPANPGRFVLQSAARGQEFVVDFDGEMGDWAGRLFED